MLHGSVIKRVKHLKYKENNFGPKYYSRRKIVNEFHKCLSRLCKTNVQTLDFCKFIYKHVFVCGISYVNI